MHHPRVVSTKLACLLGALALACAQRAGDSAGDGTSSGSDDTAGEQDPCACVPADDPDQDLTMPPPLPTCGEMLCEVVNAYWNDGDHYLSVSSYDKIACVVEAMAERTPGLVQWAYNASNFVEGGSDYTRRTYLVIREDGTAAKRTWTETASSIGVGEALAGDFLLEPSFYENCLANASDEFELYDNCMRLDSTVEGTVCSEGWSSDSP